MASYPSAIPQDPDSEEIVRDPLLVSYARSGTVKARRLQPAKKRSFVVVHKFLTATEKATLQTFFDTNRALTLTFAWNDVPATTYTVIFSDPAGLSWRRSRPLLWDTTVRLDEV